MDTDKVLKDLATAVDHIDIALAFYAKSTFAHFDATKAHDDVRDVHIAIHAMLTKKAL